ncbi:MAG TPA: response regulator, partial [Chloroflexi bacterium]|nr:response regulator [Chloroflexota bacterium]
MARILIIDPDADFVRESRRVLRTQGYQVSAADNYRDAQEVLTQGRPDLLLLDGVHDQVSDDAELMEEISQDERLRCVPVILVTPGPVDHEGSEERTEEIPRLSKPVSPETLLRATAEHVKRTAFIYSPRSADYDYGPDHPLEPRRAAETKALCERYDLL